MMDCRKKENLDIYTERKGLYDQIYITCKLCGETHPPKDEEARV